MENSLILFKFDYVNILLTLSLTGYVAFFYLTLFLKRSNYSFIYSTHIFSVLLWVIAMLFYRNAQNNQNLLTYAKILYLTAAFIPFIYYFFIQKFLQLKKSNFLNVFLILFGLFSIGISVFSIDRVNLNSSSENEVYFNKLIWIYSIHIVLFFTLAFFDLLKNYFNSKSSQKKIMFFMIFGSIISALLSGISNLILPNVGIFFLNWFGQVISLLLVITTSLAIIKYNLFGTKGINFIAFISFFLTTIILRGLFTTSLIDLLFNIFLFITSSVLGYLIIKNFVEETEEKDRILILNRKISEQNKKIEIQKNSLEELLKVKDETLHIVNHQINTPLSIIKSAAQMLKDKLWDVDKYLQVSDIEVNRLSQTVSQFLSAKRADDKTLVLNKSKVDLTTIINSIIEEKKLVKKVRDQKMEIIFTNETEFPQLNCDVGKITEVISNLLDNAISYSDKRIEVELKLLKKELVFSVKDTGIGITKEIGEKLFQRFSRGENAEKVRPSGTGLGLYVCKQIVEAHGGKIWFESKGLNQGTTFFVSLPL